ncbi:MAG: glycosyltransferase family 4 protein [Actinobacteria bacterium]|nr:glycosyltransferase family 4 protein [Actinomycetota bacterium]
MFRKILLIASDSGLGGGERNLLDIASHLSKLEEYQTHVILPREGRLADELSKLNATIAFIPMGTILNLISVFSIRHFIRNNAISLIHAHGSRAAWYARLANLSGFSIPLIYTIHGLHYPHYRSKVKKWMFILGERLLRSSTNRFICVCKADLEKGLLLGVVEPDKATVIYNGIDTAKSLDSYSGDEVHKLVSIAKDRKIIVNIGRLHKQKGHGALLEAAKLVIKRRPDSLFLVVGDGEEKQALLSKKKELNLTDDNFILVGEKSDTDFYLCLANVFVMSSLWEGLPYAILEAMSFEKPVVSTDVDGIPEAVIDKETGLLVPPGNPASLAEALLYMLDNPEFAARCGTKGFSRVKERFTVEDMLKRIMLVYEEAMKEIKKI